MRSLLALGAALIAALSLAASASAAALVSRPCNPYLTKFAGKKWVPVGVTSPLAPSQSLRLRWSDGSLAGYSQADSSGRLLTGVLMPSSFISSDARERTFGLSAFDTTSGARAGFGRVRFVRAGFDFQSRRSPHTVTRYGLWGATPGRKVWLHFYFAGQQRRVVYMGRTSKPCGVVHKRIQVLPTRSRYGKWTVYTTNSPRALSKRTIRRRAYIAFLSFTVYRVTVPRYRASAAAVR